MSGDKIFFGTLAREGDPKEGTFTLATQEKSGENPLRGGKERSDVGDFTVLLRPTGTPPERIKPL